MSIAISGTRGLVGSELTRVLKNAGHTVYELCRPEFDLTNPKSIAKFFFWHRPQFFINCAAYTDVPKAEIEPGVADSVNNLAVGYIAEQCALYGIHLIHFSTDFVFDGQIGRPYIEIDSVNPLNYYGYSKLAGENSIKIAMDKHKNNCYSIFRVQWLYGHNEKNFFQKIYAAALSGKPISLTADEYGSPCSASFISNTISKIIHDVDVNKIKGQLYHLTHDTSCSRFICGKYFLNAKGFNDVHPVNNLYMGDLKRPKYGVLDNSKLRDVLGSSLGTWEQDLDNYLLELDSIEMHKAWGSQ